MTEAERRLLVAIAYCVKPATGANVEYLESAIEAVEAQSSADQGQASHAKEGTDK